MSALQKAIRRGDTAMAGYLAIEMFESGYHNYLWKRLAGKTKAEFFQDEFRALSPRVQGEFDWTVQGQEGRDSKGL